MAHKISHKVRGCAFWVRICLRKPQALNNLFETLGASKRFFDRLVQLCNRVNACVQTYFIQLRQGKIGTFNYFQHGIC